MKTPKGTIQRILRNALLSLLIYSLPILLMFFTFSITGQKPWQKKAKTETSTTQSIKKSKK
jgi:preprotein translocase subunit YajC